MASREKGEYRTENEAGIISFDFSASDSLNLRRFFQEIDTALEEASHADICSLLLKIKGFQDEGSLKNFEPGDLRKGYNHAGNSMSRILSMKIPVLSAIRGFLCGPLLEPILFSDFIIASRSTRLSSLMMDKGYLPRMGMLSHLAEILGKEGLYHFLLYGIDLAASPAEGSAMFHGITEDEKLDAEAARLLRTLSEKDRYTMRLIKELSRHNRHLSPDEAHLLERYNFALCFSEPHFKEKIDSFLNKKE